MTVAAPFAALEDRVNRAVSARLANAVASYADGAATVNLAGIFDAAYLTTLPDGSVGSLGPVLDVETADVPPAAQGLQLVIRGAAYVVVEPQPDGAGRTLLRLRRA